MTFGQQCVEKCQAAAFIERGKGGKLGWADIAAIIDAQDLLRDGPRTAKQSKSSPFGSRRDIPPTPEQVTAYSASIGYPLDGQAWCDSYAAKGWLVGKAKMKDWQAAVRNWKRNGWGHEMLLGPKPAEKTRNYSSI